MDGVRNLKVISREKQQKPSLLQKWILSRYSILSAALALQLASCGGHPSNQHDSDHAHGHASSEQEDFERGSHGGRLLKDGRFALEVQIFEEGTPPRYRLFGYNDMKPVDARDLSAKVELERLGGRIDSFSFEPAQGFLESTREVAEPHSFDVKISAQYDGQVHTWAYHSYEGRVVIPADVAARSGVTTEKAEPHVIRTYRHCRGKIVPSEHRIAHVIPRFAGVVREGRKHIGDKVEKGEVLAVIESNQSLQPFEVRSQISGTVVNGHLVVGEYVPENQWVYIVADLSEVWADFLVPLRERGDIAAGQKVVISSVAGSENSEGRVSYVAPYADERSQAQLVRAVVPNQRGTLLPGTFIKGEIVVHEASVPVAIKRSSLQRFRDWDVVFVKAGDTYQATPVEVGRSDGDWIEVVRGLSAGDEYVTANSFLVKADILKSGASHDH